MDLRFEGRRWTYEKKVVGGSYCRVRLDRALACAEWNARFPLAYVRHLTSAASDHGPIELRWDIRPQHSSGRSGKRQFRYELMWERHSDFRNMLAQIWGDQPRMVDLGGLQRKLGAMSRSLGGWNNQSFDNVKRELKNLCARLEHLRSEPQRTGPSYEEIKTVDKIVELNHREELMWKQRSRVTWLKEGDRNTRFFHLRASQRKKRIRINKLKRADGSFTEVEEEMASLTTTFYRDLYTSEGTENTDQLLDSVPVKVTGAMNDELLKPFNPDEVKAALF